MPKPKDRTAAEQGHYFRIRVTHEDRQRMWDRARELGKSYRAYKIELAEKCRDFIATGTGSGIMLPDDCVAFLKKIADREGKDIGDVAIALIRERRNWLFRA